MPAATASSSTRPAAAATRSCRRRQGSPPLPARVGQESRPTGSTHAPLDSTDPRASGRGPAPVDGRGPIHLRRASAGRDSCRDHHPRRTRHAHGVGSLRLLLPNAACPGTETPVERDVVGFDVVADERDRRVTRGRWRSRSARCRPRRRQGDGHSASRSRRRSSCHRR